jgi:hypothetical protein
MKFAVEDTTFEVLTAVKIWMLVFWTATPRVLAGRYFRGTHCLYLQPSALNAENFWAVRLIDASSRKTSARN